MTTPFSFRGPRSFVKRDGHPPVPEIPKSIDWVLYPIARPAGGSIHGPNSYRDLRPAVDSASIMRFRPIVTPWQRAENHPELFPSPPVFFPLAARRCTVVPHHQLCRPRGEFSEKPNVKMQPRLNSGTTLTTAQNWDPLPRCTSAIDSFGEDYRR